jgi:hypothetical protein
MYGVFATWSWWNGNHPLLMQQTPGGVPPGVFRWSLGPKGTSPNPFNCPAPCRKGRPIPPQAALQPPRDFPPSSSPAFSSPARPVLSTRSCGCEALTRSSAARPLPWPRCSPCSWPGSPWEAMSPEGVSTESPIRGDCLPCTGNWNWASACTESSFPSSSWGSNRSMPGRTTAFLRPSGPTASWPFPAAWPS